MSNNMKSTYIKPAGIEQKSAHHADKSMKGLPVADEEPFPRGLLDSSDSQIDWLRVWPFIFMHVACLGVFFVGFSWFALAFAVAFYILRMFAITGFYHRYFSHKTFKTSRAVQFIFALIGTSSTQKGPLWWAAHHRHHHKYSDQEEDVHSPKKGFLWSHMGWFLCKQYFSTRMDLVRDWKKYPELLWLDKHAMLIPVVTGISIFCLGEVLNYFMPQLGTNGLQLIIWGFFVSTVVLTHATLLINSLAHRLGTRYFDTEDDSRNNFFLALITLGEGWHNNHHFSPGSTRQGFFWWQIDITYYLLKAMASIGLVWDLKPVPKKVMEYKK